MGGATVRRRLVLLAYGLMIFAYAMMAFADSRAERRSNQVIGRPASASSEARLGLG